MLFYDYEDVSYDNIVRKILRLKDNYGNMIEVTDGGVSHDNREILCVECGNIKNGGNTVVITAGVHGRENINPAVLLAVIEYICKKCEWDFEYKKIFSEMKIVFVPLLNPDGYMIAKYGFNAIVNPILREYCSNIGVRHYLWKENARYVDINRNFTCKSFMPTPYMPYGDSENETKALMTVFERYKPAAYVDIHSRGNCIYWYREAMDSEYNTRQYELAKRLCDVTGYRLAEKSEENSSVAGGNTVHFASEYYNIPAITIETIRNEAMFPLDSKYYETVYKRIKNVPYTLAKYFDK